MSNRAIYYITRKKKRSLIIFNVDPVSRTLNKKVLKID